MDSFDTETKIILDKGRKIIDILDSHNIKITIPYSFFRFEYKNEIILENEIEIDMFKGNKTTRYAINT